MEGVEVYFRSLDVDDPASDSDMDDETSDKDNFGKPHEGIFPDNKPKKTARDRDRQMAAVTDFQVTMQPGDNFRVVATCVSQTALDGVTAPRKVSDGRVVDGNDKVITDDNTPATIKASPVLTVWRKLHVEVDSMGAPPGSSHPERNSIRGDIVEIEGTGKEARKLILAPQVTDPALGLDDGSPNLSKRGLEQGNGRFEKGAILITTALSAVLSQEDDQADNVARVLADLISQSSDNLSAVAGSVLLAELDGNGNDYVEKKDGMIIPFQLVDHRGGNPIPEKPNQQVSLTGMDVDKKEFELSESVKNVNYAGGKLTVGGVNFTVMEAKGKKVTVVEEAKLPFVLVDDDRATSLFLVKPPMGEDAQAGTPFELMQRSDSAQRNLLARAYVKPVYDLNSSTIDFKRNVEESNDVMLLVNNAQTFPSSPTFWVAHLVGAFQGPAYRKVTDDQGRERFQGDGDPDVEVFTARGLIERTTVGGTTGQQGRTRFGSLVYRETLRDTNTILRIDCLAYSVTHEVGHQFWITHVNPDHRGGINEPCTPSTVNANRFFTNAQLKTIRGRPQPQGTDLR